MNAKNIIIYTIILIFTATFNCQSSLLFDGFTSSDFYSGALSPWSRSATIINNPILPASNLTWSGSSLVYERNQNQLLGITYNVQTDIGTNFDFTQGGLYNAISIKFGNLPDNLQMELGLLGTSQWSVATGDFFNPTISYQAEFSTEKRISISSNQSLIIPFTDFDFSYSTFNTEGEPPPPTLQDALMNSRHFRVYMTKSVSPYNGPGTYEFDEITLTNTSPIPEPREYGLVAALLLIGVAVHKTLEKSGI
jgi:hypothetical protein